MTLRRIWKYASKYKALVFVSLFSLFLAIGIELLLPICFKTIIDDHLIGIEKPWYEVDESAGKTVRYGGRHYAQERNLRDKELWVTEENEVRIFLINNVFYFVDEAVAGGAKEIADGKLVVTDDDGNIYAYDYAVLAGEDVLAFYRTEISPIAELVAYYVSLNVLLILISYAYRYNFFKLGNKVTYDIRCEAFRKIQKLPVSYFDKTPAGKIVARVTNDTQTIIDLFARTLIVFISAIVLFVGIYISMFALNAKLAAYTLALIPLLLLWGTIYRRKAKKYNEVIRGENAEINAYLNQSIKGMEIIQAFNRENLCFEEFEHHNRRYYSYRKKMQMLNAAGSFNLIQTFRRLIYAIIILYFGWGALGVQNIVEVGVIYAFVEYMNKLINPIQQVFSNLDVFEQSMVSGSRVFYLLDQEEIPLHNDKIPRFKGDIEFKNFSFAYENDHYVLKNINLKVEAGGTVAIVGHTGSGKSSLMNVLLRFYDFSEGEILIDGRDIRSFSRQAFRRHIGIVLQDPTLFSGTVAENIRLNNPAISDGMIEEALRKIGADRIIEKYAKGIHERVAEMGANYSVGERQLISFARALIYDPAVLVLDEATANIDTETEQLIQKALKVVKENRTTFIIAHRLSTVKDASQIVVLDAGRIVERGNHEELMARRGQYYEMYRAQMQQP